MVDLNFKSLFPSPFAFANFGESSKQLNKELIRDIDEEMLFHGGETKKKASFSLNEYGWQSRSGLENSYDSFKELSIAVTKCLSPMMTQSGIQEEYASRLKAAGLWATVIFGAGGFAEPHIHGSGETLWTGVYYPAGTKTEDTLDNFDINKHILGETTQGSGNLVLKDPAHIQKRMVQAPYKHRRYYGASVTVVPRESLLVLFPTWIEHYVQPVTDKTKRYSISFCVNKG